MDLPRYLTGDSLGDLRHRVRPAKNRKLGMPEHVDETRSDDLTIGIDHALGAQPHHRRPDVRNAIADRGYAATVPWIPGAVDDARVGDEDVVARHGRALSWHGRAGR